MDAQSSALPSTFEAALRRGRPQQVRLQMSAGLDGPQSPDWEMSIARCCPDCACTRSLVFGPMAGAAAPTPSHLLPTTTSPAAGGHVAAKRLGQGLTPAGLFLLIPALYGLGIALADIFLHTLGERTHGTG
jgi:hypothetical protein